MKKIIIDIKNRIVFLFNTIWNNLHFRYMKNKAEKLHKLTGKQYFVVPKTKTSCMVVDNTFIKIYNQNASKMKVKKITYPDLLRMCYYKTSAGAYKNR